MNFAPDPAISPPGEVAAGHVLGRYELLLPIASGGMAMVWAARLKGTRGFQKIVAVKTMLPKLSEDEQFEKMFLDEASLASQIRHPHVVEVLDLGEQEGVLFLVMEWIEGVALNQLLKAARTQGGVPNAVAVRIAMQACAGLHAAHELRNDAGDLVGLVHRDVSPQNILVTYDGVAKVVDFGVAKATAMGDGATVAGQIKGKVAYMAPEQVKGSEIDRRVDVFALGIVLYALTTGKHPFRKETEAATMYNICAPQPALPPRKVVENYPPQLEGVVLKALAKDPSKRYQTTNEMLKALDRLPPALRANTDEDVALFIRKLFEERRASRRASLAEAIERANQNPHPKTDWSSVERSMPSGVSVVSRSSPQMPSAVTVPDSAAGVPSTAAAYAAAIDLAIRRRGPWLYLAGGALLALAAVAVFAALSSESRDAPAPAPPPALVASPGPRPVDTEGEPGAAQRPAPDSHSVASATSAADLAVEDLAEQRDHEQLDAGGVQPGVASQQPAAPAPSPQPVAPGTALPPAPTAQPSAPNWKHDPGF